MRSCLVDAGIIFALFDQSDHWHARAQVFVDTYPGKLIVAASVVPEVACLVNKYLGAEAEIDLINAVSQGEFKIENLLPADYTRACVLMKQHMRMNIGFVDAVNVAMCERLKLADLATVDRRHFSAIQPSHRARLNLLPDA